MREQFKGANLWVQSTGAIVLGCDVFGAKCEAQKVKAQSVGCKV